MIVCQLSGACASVCAGGELYRTSESVQGGQFTFLFPYLLDFIPPCNRIILDTTGLRKVSTPIEINKNIIRLTEWVETSYYKVDLLLY